VLTIRGRADAAAAPEGLAPLYLEYEPGDYERSFALSDAVAEAAALRRRLPAAANHPAERRANARDQPPPGDARPRDKRHAC
jgi:hypothetical protein